MSGPRRLAALLAAAGLSLACRDSSAPPGAGRLRDGDWRDGVLSPGRTEDLYAFDADSGDERVVALDAVNGQFEVVVARQGHARGPTISPSLGYMIAVTSRPGSGLPRLAAMNVSFGKRGVYEILVRRTGAQPDSARSPYRLTMRRQNRKPEGAAEQIAIGDVVAGEALDEVMDFDEFRFRGERGQLVNLFLQATGTGTSAGIHAFVYRAENPRFSSHYVWSSAGDASLEDQASGPIVLPETGEYRVHVSTTGSCCPGPYVGPYRVRVSALDPRP